MNRFRIHFTLLLFFLFPVILTTCGGGNVGCGGPPSPVPSIPVLTAKAVSVTHIDLSWTPSSDINSDLAGYRIFRDNAYLTTITLTYLHKTSYSDTVAPNVRYCYRVAAYDKQGNESSQSNEACAITDFEKPSTPINLHLTSSTLTSLTFAWDPASDNFGVSGYRIYRDGAYRAFAAATATTDPGLAPGTQYCYTVSTADMAGNESLPSDQLCASTLPDLDAPAAPENLTAAAVSPSAIHLAWTAATDNVGVAGYKVYRDGAYVADAGSTTYLNTGLNSDIPYCYTVSANDASGNESVQSAQACATTSWTISTIDNGFSAGTHGSLAVDPAGKVHASYLAADPVYCIPYYYQYCYDLKYAVNTSGSWSTTTLAGVGPGYYRQDTSLALDPNGAIHVSYYDGTNLDLKYATNAAGSWVHETLDSLGSVGLYSSLTVDPSGFIHVSYYDATNGDLKYATNSSGSWTIATLDSTGDVGTFTSVAVDQSGKVHISYYDRTTWSLKYATNKTGAWTYTTLRTFTSQQLGMDYHTSLAVDAGGNAHKPQ